MHDSIKAFFWRYNTTHKRLRQFVRYFRKFQDSNPQPFETEQGACDKARLAIQGEINSFWKFAMSLKDDVPISSSYLAIFRK